LFGAWIHRFGAVFGERWDALGERFLRFSPSGGEEACISPTTRDFTAEAAENAENGRKQGDSRTTTGEHDSKGQRSAPFSAFSAISAVKK